MSNQLMNETPDNEALRLLAEFANETRKLFENDSIWEQTQGKTSTLFLMNLRDLGEQARAYLKDKHLTAAHSAPLTKREMRRIADEAIDRALTLAGYE